MERIELRATQIQTYDGRVALVPNADVLASRIINNTADPVRRGSVEMTLDQRADLAAPIPRIREAVQRADGVLERPVTARTKDLGTDGALLYVGFWAGSRRSDFRDTSSAVSLGVVEALRAAGGKLSEPAHWRCGEGGGRTAVHRLDARLNRHRADAVALGMLKLQAPCACTGYARGGTHVG